MESEPNVCIEGVLLGDQQGIVKNADDPWSGVERGAADDRGK
jgi:hypothetical protein